MKTIYKYWKLWWLYTKNAFQISLTSWTSVGIFLLAKSLRFVTMLIFLLSLTSKTKMIGGYSSEQIIFFYITFMFIDDLSQIFFREVYRFHSLIVKGDFDLVLIKPMNALFRSLMGGSDLMDALMTIPYGIMLVVMMTRLPPISWEYTVVFLFLLVNSLMISMAFHIIVISLAIFTTEVDHTIMVYRDIERVAVVPVDIYKEPLRSIVTFVIPIGLMMTIPAKMYLGLLSWQWVVLTCVIGLTFWSASIWFWKQALKKYSSASS